MALLVACLAPAKAGSAASLGVVSDFETGAQGWGSGDGSLAPNPHPPVIETDGGPTGVADAYLRVIARGLPAANGEVGPAYDGGFGEGSGSRLVVFNDSPDWRGDYTAAGIAAIEFDIKNLTSAALSIRLQIDGMRGDGVVTSSAHSLPAFADWTHLRFPILPVDLTAGLDVNAVLSNVTKLRIVHNPAATRSPLTPPPPVNAEIGIDNVRTMPVPEPSLALLTGAGLLVLAAARRGGRRGRLARSSAPDRDGTRF
jgi:hypothetical protein